MRVNSFLCKDVPKTNTQNNFQLVNVEYTWTNTSQSTPKLYNLNSNLTQFNILPQGLKFLFIFCTSFRFLRRSQNFGLPLGLSVLASRHVFQLFISRVSRYITEWLLIHFITTCLGNYKTTCFTCRQANPSKVLGPNYNRITIAMRVSGLSPSRFEIVPELVSCSQAGKDMPVHQIITKYIQPDDMQSKTKPIPEKFQLENDFSLGTVAFQQHYLLLLCFQ